MVLQYIYGPTLQIRQILVFSFQFNTQSSLKDMQKNYLNNISLQTV